MRSEMIAMPYWKQYCTDVFQGLNMENRPHAKETTIDQGGVDIAATNIFFGNGGEDPWRWATKQESVPELNQVSRVSDCNDCGHCAELYTPKDTDPDELKETRVMVADWLEGILTRPAPDGFVADEIKDVQGMLSQFTQ